MQTILHTITKSKLWRFLALSMSLNVVVSWSAILDSLANTAIKYFIVSCQVRVAKTTSSRKSSPLSSDLEPKFCLASQLWILGTKSITTNFKQNASRKPWTHVFLFVCLFFVCLFGCLLACLFVCLLACLLALLFVCLFVCLFVWLFECLIVWWFDYVWLFVRLFVSLFDDFVTYYWMCVHCFPHACIVWIIVFYHCWLWLFTSPCIGYNAHRVSFCPEEKLSTPLKDSEGWELCKPAFFSTRGWVVTIMIPYEWLPLTLM